MSAAISTAHIDYLLRSDVRPDGLGNATSLTSAPPSLRRLLRVHGVGRVEKVSRPEPGQPQRLISEDVLIGLSGYNLPFAFLIRGQPGDVALYLGTWADSQNPVTRQAMDEQSGILQTVVKSLYPEVKLAEQTDVPLSALRRAGFALGVPVAKPPDLLDSALPIDRLIRALAGTKTNWACLVLAQPVDESTIGKQRNKVINELREIESQAQATQAPSPLTKHYSELLNVLLKTLTAGQAVGMWRTGVYLLGDQTSYPHLASAWRSIFAGDQSLPEPVRILENPAAAELAEQWALPYIPATDSPGHYRHPFLYQTMLTSTQLAAYAHLPQVETSGFSVSTIPAFDVVPAPIKEPISMPIGNVVEHTVETSTAYAIAPTALTRHVFVAGVTGSGKTTTIHHLLKGAARLGVPFMVIEPAKTEYRKLLNEPELKNNLQVFTLGNEMVSPFRLNPFEVPQDIPIGVHIDLLRSVFYASFGMWSPLPEILEQCLHGIYTDRGWDIATNSNNRLSSGKAGAAAFPTLSDLVAKVEEFIQGLDYDKEVASNIRAALLNRLNTLRAGGKGRMLDVQRSLPMSVLLEHSTILELEGMGDDDDRAFMIGLLVIRLIEHRRAEDERERAEKERERAEKEQRRVEGKQPNQTDNSERLRHLLVVEEAHRLLSNVGPRDTALQGNPRGKAVETFANLLAEIRVYGQGLIVVDQVPVKLAPDVIKNTNLKIAHRVVDAEDRRVLAGSMAMSDRQMASLAILETGQAAVFAERDDAPLLVKIPKKKPVQGAKHWSNDRLASYMGSAATMQPFRSFLLAHNGCTDTRPPAGLACQAARRLAEDPHVRRTFARVVQSMLEDPDALDRMWDELMEVIRPRRPATVDEDQLLRCFTFHAAHWFCGRRGAQAGWSYPETLHLEEQLRCVLQARLDGAPPSPLRIEFRQYALQLHRREYDPYPACSHICPQPVCLYRYAAADLAIRGTFNEAWRKANDSDSQRQDNRRIECWDVAVQAADHLTGLPRKEHLQAPAHAYWKRAGLCFAQQILTNDSANLPADVTFVLQNLLKEAEL